jgi:hypothetical protein
MLFPHCCYDVQNFITGWSEILFALRCQKLPSFLEHVSVAINRLPRIYNCKLCYRETS